MTERYKAITFQQGTKVSTEDLKERYAETQRLINKGTMPPTRTILHIQAMRRKRMEGKLV